jgi:hypothetical protein
MVYIFYLFHVLVCVLMLLFRTWFDHSTFCHHQENYHSAFRSFCSDVFDDSVLLGCDGASLDNWIQMFRDSIPSSSSIVMS